MLRRLMRPGRGGCLLVGELASALCCLVLDIGLLNTSSHLLPLSKSVPLLKREAFV
jgi:hypothetical protein